MCGFFASNYHFNDIGLLKKKLDFNLSFRGPDFQSDVVEYKGWYLYHARLSIIGISPNFNQPYCGDKGVLVYNGEILNYKELGVKYFYKEYLSDTEFLYDYLNLHSPDLNQLDGFFSFVFIDNNGILKIAARDKFGVKPLFTTRKGSSISYSSEPNILVDLFNLTLNSNALLEYKFFRYPLTMTYYNNLYEVPPGSTSERTYFSARDYLLESKPISFLESYDGIKKSLENSIKSRLISDAPVGLLFSGGIDSNLISALCGDNSIKKFTIGTQDDFDTQWAKKTTDATVIEYSSEAFLERLNQMVSLRREPLSVPNEVNLSLVADCWQNSGGKVLLSGEGADEFFGGYDRIFHHFHMCGTKFNVTDFLNLYLYASSEQLPAYLFEYISDYFADLSDYSNFNKLRIFFIEHHLPVLFRRLDFSLMFSGIEGREPFCSLDVFNASIVIDPSDVFSSFGLGKMHLRYIAKKLFGKEFAYSKKVGFPIDFKKILTGINSVDNNESYTYWRDYNMRLL